MSDRSLDPRLPHRPDAAGFEPALGGPGRELLARHAAVLAQLPAELTAGLPPERVLWNLWSAALSGQVPWSAELEQAQIDSADFVRNHLPDDVLGAIEQPLRRCWSAEDSGSAAGGAIWLFCGGPVNHRQSRAIHRLFAELAGLPSRFNDVRTCLPALLSADRIRDDGGGELLRRGLEARPDYLPLLLDPDDDEVRQTWDLGAALSGGAGRGVLADIAAALERWYRNCPPGAPVDAGVRVPFGMLGELKIVPGLPLLRVALERLSGAAQWKSGLYDATRPLVQAVRRAVWIGGESPADIRAFLRSLPAAPKPEVAPRQALIRLALLNPLFGGYVEAMLELDGLGAASAAASEIDWNSGRDVAPLVDLLPPAFTAAVRRADATARPTRAAADEILAEYSAMQPAHLVAQLRRELQR